MKTVLVVDDDEERVQIIRTALERAGYQAVCAVSGNEAITTLDNRMGDAVVLWELTPRMDWFELTIHLRTQASTRYLLIYLLSSVPADSISDSFIIRTFRANIDHTFAAPVDPAELIEWLRRDFRARDDFTSHP